MTVSLTDTKSLTAFSDVPTTYLNIGGSSPFIHVLTMTSARISVVSFWIQLKMRIDGQVHLVLALIDVTSLWSDIFHLRENRFKEFNSNRVLRGFEIKAIFCAMQMTLGACSSSILNRDLDWVRLLGGCEIWSTWLIFCAMLNTQCAWSSRILNSYLDWVSVLS